MVEVSGDDRTNKDLHYGEKDLDAGQDSSQVLHQLKILRKQLERHRRIVAGFRQRIETDMTELKHQLESRVSQRRRTEGVVATTSDFYDELGIGHQNEIVLKSYF